MPDYTIKHDGKEYTVRANSPEEAAAAFDSPQAPAQPGMNSPEAAAMTQRNARSMMPGEEDYAPAEMAAKAQGAKDMEAGVAEGGKQLWGGLKQLGGGIQDAYNMIVHGQPSRKEEIVPDANGVRQRNTAPLESSAEYKTTAQEMLRQAMQTQTDMDRGVSIPSRNIAAGATQLGAATFAPEAALPRATTAVGALVKNSAAGAAGTGLMFDAEGGRGGDAAFAAAAAPVFGVIPSLLPAVKNYIGRGLSRVIGEGRTAARVASAASALPETAKTFSLAQRTGIPEMVTLERSAYNSKMVNHFADQTDTFVKEATDILRQPMREGQTLSNDFVSARARADKNIKDFRASANENYESGIRDAVRIANENSGGARIPLPGLQTQVANTFDKVRRLRARGKGVADFNNRFMDSVEGMFRNPDGTAKNFVSAQQLADTLVDITARQRGKDPLTRKLAGELREAIESDLSQLEGNATFEADDATKTILETRAEYRRAQNLIGELGDSAAYKLLGVKDHNVDPTDVLEKFKSFNPEKQVEVRKFLEDNSPDLLVSMKQATVDEAKRHAATIRAGADSQQDLNKMMDAMFDSSKGYDMRTQGIWNADELKRIEGIKDGLRTVANNRPTMGGAGTPIKSEDLAINLVSRSEAFIARQATRIGMGAKAADFFTDPKVYQYLTKINRSTTGSATNMAARAALLDYLQTDYAEQKQQEQQ